MEVSFKCPCCGLPALLFIGPNAPTHPPRCPESSEYPLVKSIVAIHTDDVDERHSTTTGASSGCGAGASGQPGDGVDGSGAGRVHRDEGRVLGGHQAGHGAHVDSDMQSFAGGCTVQIGADGDCNVPDNAKAAPAATGLDSSASGAQPPVEGLGLVVETTAGRNDGDDAERALEHAGNAELIGATKRATPFAGEESEHSTIGDRASSSATASSSSTPSLASTSEVAPVPRTPVLIVPRKTVIRENAMPKPEWAKRARRHLSE